MLQKQQVPIVLDKGIDTKTNKKQLQGKLLDLRNGIFQTGMEIRKRNGYIPLPSLGKGVMLATYNNELVTLDGTSLFSYSAATTTQVNKGALPTVSMGIQTVIRDNHQQTTQDMAVNGNLQCFSWTDSSGGIRYSVYDTVTEQSIVNNGAVDPNGTVAKVLAIGTKFLIIYYQSTGQDLNYRAIDVSTPTAIGAQVIIASSVNTTTPIFDATIINGAIFFAFNRSTASIGINSISSSLVLGTQKNFGSDNCNVISIFTDPSFNVWVAYAIDGSSGVNTTINVFVLSNNLVTTILGKTTIDAFQISGTGPLIQNLACVFNGSNAYVYYEVVQAAIVAGEPLDFINVQTITIAGSLGSPAVFNRGVGLASKIFSDSTNWYFLVAYESNLQSSYFLIRNDDVIIGKLSPQEGGGYTENNILPEFVNAGTGIWQTASLVKDSLTVQNGVIASQTGILMATFTFQSTAPSKFVLGNNLHVDGAIVKMYDGANTVEHGFNVFPEGLYSTFDSANPTYNGGVGIGASSATVNQKQYCAVYEWADNQGQPHRSAPSVPVTVNLPKPAAPTTIVGDLNGSGSPPHSGTTILNVVGSATVGQYINLVSATGKVNWAWNATITNISGTTITVSTPYQLVASSGHTFLISNYPLGLFFTVIPQPTTLLAGFGEVNGVFGQVFAAPPGLVSNYPAGTFFRSGAFTVGAGFDTNNPPTGLGTTNMYYAVDTFTIPVEIPTLRLTDKKNVSLAVYATLVNGTIFFRVSDPINLILNDKTVDYVVFSDTTPDAFLIGNQQLYTSSGEVENIGVPSVNVSTTFKSRAIVVPSENPLSWWPSKQVIPGFPVEFSDIFVQNIDSRIQKISAVGAMDDKIIFCGPTSLFYVVGSGPAPNGTSNDYTEAQLISSDVGCLNQASIVLMPFGLMFQSQKGIYLLDRSLGVQYIGAEVEAFNSFNVTSAQLMDTVNQVRFTLSNGIELVYDYFYKQWDIFSDINAADSGIFQNQHTFINPSGAIWQESNVFSDNGAAILLSFISNWLSFANIQGFQRVYSFLLLGDYKSPHVLTINIYANFNDEVPAQTTVIPVLSDPIDYQFRVFMNEFVAKSEAVKIEVIESQPNGVGEGFSVSNMAFVVGVKRGPYKVPAAKSYG